METHKEWAEEAIKRLSAENEALKKSSTKLFKLAVHIAGFVGFLVGMAIAFSIVGMFC